MTRGNHYDSIVRLHGHLIDSLTLAKVFDEILDRGGDYESEEISIGRTKKDLSIAKIRVTAPDPEILSSILKRLHQLGASVEHEEEIVLEKAKMDGVFPDGFYATTNLPTEVFYQSEWRAVENIGMDCGVEWDHERLKASSIKMNDVKKDHDYVVGIQGIRVQPQNEAIHSNKFRFMNSDVSTEKPKGIYIKQIAEQLRTIKNSDDEAIFVCGPAVVHTGARDYLCQLIEGGYVHRIFAGNALAVHDIEAALYGTSLGVSLAEGLNTSGGHRNHLYAINTIRSLGGIKKAVEQGILKNGIMYSCIKHDCSFLLAGSIRDDGPLPEVITDAVQAQSMMREKVKKAKLVVMLSTMLHSIAVGNLLPASVQTVCVDISPSTVTKLMDRGSHQAMGLVMDVEAFLHELCEYL